MKIAMKFVPLSLKPYKRHDKIKCHKMLQKAKRKIIILLVAKNSQFSQKPVHS